MIYRTSYRIDSPDAPKEARAMWHYTCPVGDKYGVIELGVGKGRNLQGLDFHIDSEDQMTCVLKGRRHFIFPDGRQLTLQAGQAALIPAETIHASLTERDDMENVCVNLYLTAGALHVSENMHEILRAHLGNLPVKIKILPEIPKLSLSEEICTDLLKNTIQGLAAKEGIARETYSRYFRHLYGISPCAAKLLVQVGKAKQLLRFQRDIAQTALMTGFYDQSHLGKHFKRMIGTTPGKFSRSGLEVTNIL